MHLSVVKIDFHVDDAIACHNAFLARCVNPFLHRRYEDAIHVLACQRLREFDISAAWFGLDAHPDLRELPGASCLFLVAIFRLAAAFNRFTIWHSWLDEIEVDPVAPL